MDLKLKKVRLHDCHWAVPSSCQQWLVQDHQTVAHLHCVVRCPSHHAASQLLSDVLSCFFTTPWHGMKIVDHTTDRVPGDLICNPKLRRCTQTRAHACTHNKLLSHQKPMSRGAWKCSQVVLQFKLRGKGLLSRTFSMNIQPNHAPQSLTIDHSDHALTPWCQTSQDKV
jgi:hypothetical protein